MSEDERGLRHVLMRKWKYTPPGWVMFEALALEHARWLHPSPDETLPVVVESSRPHRVVFRPWLHPVVDQVEALISPLADEMGSQIRFIARSESGALTDDLRRVVRHRMGVTFGESLREWVDEPR